MAVSVKLLANVEGKHLLYAISEVGKSSFGEPKLKLSEGYEPGSVKRVFTEGTVEFKFPLDVIKKVKRWFKNEYREITETEIFRITLQAPLAVRATYSEIFFKVYRHKWLPCGSFYEEEISLSDYEYGHLRERFEKFVGLLYAKVTPDNYVAV